MTKHSEEHFPFGEIGIEVDFFSREDLIQVLEVQAKDLANGMRKPIGAYFLENGMLTKKQIGIILSLQEKFKVFAKRASAMVYRIHVQNREGFEFFDDSFYQLTGFSRAELMPTREETIDVLILSEDRERVRKIWRNALSSKESFSIEYRIRCKDGTVKHLAEEGYPSWDSSGILQWMDGTVFDVTDKRNRFETQQKFAFVVDTIKEFLTLIRRDFVYEAVNQSYANAHQKEASELVGKSILEIWGETVFEVIRPFFERCLSGEEVHYQREFHFCSLGHRFFDVSYYPYFSAGKVTHVVVISRDITDRRMVDEERARLIAAVEQAGEGIVITDSSGSVKFANPAFLQLIGCSLPEILEKGPSFLMSEGQTPEFFQEMWATVQSGKPWQKSITSRKKNGAELNVHSTVSPAFDDSGKIVNFVGITRDITCQVENENRIRHLQKMDAIGTLASGIAHDFNNILNGILGYTELLSLQIPENSGSSSDLEAIMTAIQRAKKLILQILAFSRKSELERRPVRLDTIVEEALVLLLPTIPKSISLRKELPSLQENVLGNSDQLHQVIMNLCLNAVQAMPSRKGEIKISLAEKRFNSQEANKMGLSTSGDYIFLTVEDNGKGMDEATIQRAFEPYFSTKSVGEGTGLGLTIVHNIVRDHEGKITIESEVGKGTVVKVFFPVHHGPLDTFQRADLSTFHGEGEVIFVDDERGLMELGGRRLQILGFTPAVFSGGLEALKAFQTEPHRYCMIITDYQMPQISGLDFIRKIREISPTVPIMLCSGQFSDSLAMESLASLKVSQLLLKPFSMRDFSSAIKKALSSKV